jgi:hypothetical protein
MTIYYEPRDERLLAEKLAERQKKETAEERARRIWKITEETARK